MDATTLSPGTLYVVGLPIGNLEDITLRALRVLREVDLIAAEDTRHLEKYRRAYRITTPALSLYEHNEEQRSRQLVARLLAGQRVALVSDAGTPLVSDPGYRVVRAALDQGIPVTSLPGACAAITALTVSGLSPAEFRFVGFPPRSAERRRTWLARFRGDPATLIFYEAPHRLLASLEDVRVVLGDRSICLARNMTKPREQYLRGPVSEIVRTLASEERVRGEATVVVEGAGGAAAASAERGESAAAAADGAGEAPPAEAARAYLAAGLTTPEIVERLVGERGLTRRAAYRLVLAARRDAGAVPPGSAPADDQD